ncbi:ATP-binding protein [Nonomuraea sp. NPDC049309]|uniref:ATP-binding protein n=1 Tax=Nonomuraea sp. NPDC049309 TaxID=3364350 RepID=UPI00371D6476
MAHCDQSCAAAVLRRGTLRESTSTDDKQIHKTIARYSRVGLPCFDGLGYLERNRSGAELLFQVLTERAENNSMAIASSGWAKTFASPRLCAAIVDCLTFGGPIIDGRRCFLGASA